MYVILKNFDKIKIKVEPANNGVYQEDILLTEQQANALINQINQNSVC